MKKYLAYTLAEVPIAKRESGKMSLLKLSRTSELKAPSSKFLKRCAFTLAEVLITLSIIGIVAQATIPTLTASAEKQTSLSRLKKFYSEFSQGIQLYASNQGCNSDLRCTGIFDGSRSDAAWNTNIDAAFKSMFKITKSTSNETDYSTKSIKYLDKSAATASFYYGHTFTTADGFLFLVYDSDSGNCTYNSGADITAKLRGYCTAIYVDVNNTSKPDQWGKDIFLFYLGNDGVLYPSGGLEVVKVADANSYWRNNATLCGTAGSTAIAAGNLGNGCAGRIMEEGWQVTYY